MAAKSLWRELWLRQSACAVTSSPRALKPSSKVQQTTLGYSFPVGTEAGRGSQPASSAAQERPKHNTCVCVTPFQPDSVFTDASVVFTWICQRVAPCCVVCFLSRWQLCLLASTEKGQIQFQVQLRLKTQRGPRRYGNNFLMKVITVHEKYLIQHAIEKICVWGWE